MKWEKRMCGCYFRGETLFTVSLWGFFSLLNTAGHKHQRAPLFSAIILITLPLRALAGRVRVLCVVLCSRRPGLDGLCGGRQGAARVTMQGCLPLLCSNVSPPLLCSNVFLT